jgi:hypothetical protein
MPKERAIHVFTPSDYPKRTYVQRDEDRVEQRLRDALDTPGEIISISGPSKSGKTVLVERVVGDAALITITGAGITCPDDLWNRVLDWMELPAGTTDTLNTGVAGELSAGTKAEVGVPLIKGSIEGRALVSATASAGNSRSHMRRGMQQVIDEVSNSEFVLLIDDFHYMPSDVQREVAKQLKEAARQKVKICTVSVPHRSDDVVRSNSELRGRIQSVDITYWTPQQLRRIAEIGFPLLNCQLDNATIEKFAIEASGSPQLMQAICLQTCFELDIREALDVTKVLSCDSGMQRQILASASGRTDFGSLVTRMHAGPKSRGVERREHTFTDNSRGDAYRCILLAISSHPPSLSFPYKNLSLRVEGVCTTESPQPASIYQACSQIAKIAISSHPDQRILEWNDEQSLDIVDPYFLFYLRWSDKLHELAEDDGSR